MWTITVMTMRIAKNRCSERHERRSAAAATARTSPRAALIVRLSACQASLGSAGAGPARPQPRQRLRHRADGGARREHVEEAADDAGADDDGQADRGGRGDRRAQLEGRVEGHEQPAEEPGEDVDLEPD